jgi:hypothetical protein
MQKEISLGYNERCMICSHVLLLAGVVKNNKMVCFAHTVLYLWHNFYNIYFNDNTIKTKPRYVHTFDLLTEMSWTYNSNLESKSSQNPNPYHNQQALDILNFTHADDFYVWLEAFIHEKDATGNFPERVSKRGLVCFWNLYWAQETKNYILDR